MITVDFRTELWLGQETGHNKVQDRPRHKGEQQGVVSKKPEFAVTDPVLRLPLVRDRGVFRCVHVLHDHCGAVDENLRCAL